MITSLRFARAHRTITPLLFARAQTFLRERSDCSGPGLTSPGESVEVWSKLDPGNYIVICWNAGHATTRKPHPFTVQYTVSDDAPPVQIPSRTKTRRKKMLC